MPWSPSFRPSARTAMPRTWIYGSQGAVTLASSKTTKTSRTQQTGHFGGTQNQEISSAIFDINPKPAESSSSSATSSPTHDSTTQPTSTTPADSNGLFTGAKARIGVGVSAGGLIIIALAFFLWRRSKALQNAKAPGRVIAGGYNDIRHPPPLSDEHSPAHPGAEGYFTPVIVKVPPPKSVSAPLSELPGNEAAELDGGSAIQLPPVELDASTHKR
ncbi:hypothetical protein BJX76DRAFT_355023 [Aspergillus varians]